jgi:hypothetical protein
MGTKVVENWGVSGTESLSNQSPTVIFMKEVSLLTNLISILSITTKAGVSLRRQE